MSKRHEQTFHRRYTDGNEHMKVCSRPLAITEVQNEATVKYHTPIIMAKIVSSEW